MKDCIFCKIVNGEIPASKIYEDEKILVFLDVNPATNGHMLIIPKKHYQDLLTISDDIINHSIKIIREKLYPLVKDKLNCVGMSLGQNNGYGQEVKHFHIHLIPRYNNDQHVQKYNKNILLPIDEVFSTLTDK